jgi:hypothetical protein
MIEKITDNKYLYHGRVVDLAFLQQRKAELEQMVKDNEAQIEAIELLDTDKLSGAMKEAAELYNSNKEDKINFLEAENAHLITQIIEISEYTDTNTK